MSLETRGQHELLGRLVACTYSDPFVEATGLFDFDDRRACSNTTVGWLIEYAEDVVRIAAEQADAEQWRWVTTIPRPVVVALDGLCEEVVSDEAAAQAARAPAAGEAPSRG